MLLDQAVMIQLFSRSAVGLWSLVYTSRSEARRAQSVICEVADQTSVQRLTPDVTASGNPQVRGAIYPASATERTGHPRASPVHLLFTDAVRVRAELLRCEFLRVNYRLEKEGPFDPGEMILSGSIP